MKLFQQLLVAPAALGLLAPMAANAAELNINDVSGYSDSIQEVEGISQFSDVYPTDWAYQALTNLADRHGCVAATPSGSMTRYEAAALLNKCLGNVAQVNDEERRLLNEFGPELAVIKGRLDGLEARVGEFEAGQFSTTTKMSGKVAMVLGGYDRVKGDDKATTFTYSKTINLNTSFNGDDLLYTRLKTGNMSSTPWATKTYGTYLSVGATYSSLTVDKLWYQFPVGDFKVWVGPKIENYYMLASAPSIYKPVLKGFSNGGNGSTYGSSTDGGFGVAWTQPVDDRSQARFAISSGYVSKGAAKANGSTGGGILGDNQAKWLTKLEYGSPRWQVSLAYSRDMCDKDVNRTATESCKNWYEYYTTEQGANRTGNADNIGLRGYWKPFDTGLIPAIQVGYDVSHIDDDEKHKSTKDTVSWMVGLMWKDAFIDGNKAGVAFGQRQFATKAVDRSPSGVPNDPADENFIWEAYYDFKVSDNITVTPAIFGAVDSYQGEDSGSDDWLGGVIQTVFKF